MNAPIKYLGGKNSMFNHIVKHFPKPEEYNIYIEPFGGSYGIGFHMDYIPPIEIYNDLYENVYALYKVIADKELFPKFKEMADTYPYSEQFRAEFREDLKNPNLSLLDRAFRFFYVNRSSHNGIGGMSVNMVVRRNMAKSVSDYLSVVDNLEEYHQRMSHMVIMHRDAVDLMDRYKDYEGVFMYCDPPYEWSTRGETRYAVDMDADGQQRFIDACLRSNAKLLISGYDCELYDQLTDAGFKKIQFDVNTVSGTREKKTKVETLWKNY